MKSLNNNAIIKIIAKIVTQLVLSQLFAMLASIHGFLCSLRFICSPYICSTNAYANLVV